MVTRLAIGQARPSNVDRCFPRQTPVEKWDRKWDHGKGIGNYSVNASTWRRPYTKGLPLLSHVEVDGRLITGQNPRSAKKVAEAVVRALNAA